MTIAQGFPCTHGEASLIGIMYVDDIFTVHSHISNCCPCQWLECEPLLGCSAQGRIEKIVKCKLQFTLEKYFHIYTGIMFMGEDALQNRHTITMITADETIFIFFCNSMTVGFCIRIEQWQIAIAILLAIGDIKCICGIGFDCQ
ncbi:hypothetical protein BFW41_07110 [Aeromonas hydrophila]|nr:hypothetical protein BFW41_07110 [Aeromonas hydrophila]